MKNPIWLSIIVCDRSVSDIRTSHACAYRLDEITVPENELEDVIRSLLGSQANAIAKIVAQTKK